MSILQKSLKLKTELDLLRPINEADELRIMQKFRLDWNYHSNNLEGNTLTYGETKALILFGITAQGKPLKDHFEVTGHDDAIKWIVEIVKQDRPLTENFIRELHQLILKESYEVDAITPTGQPTKKRVNVGVYKSNPNHVKTKTGEIFRFATPEETPAMMYDLVQWYREKVTSENTNPILLASEFHYKYIRIHPFDDGNGRTARILMNFILMQFGYPPAIIKTEDKLNYFAALRQADAGLLEPFIDYIAKNLNHSLELMIKGAKGESIEEPDDLEKEIALLEQKLKFVSNKINISKSKETLLEVYDKSIKPLMQKFIEKCALFNKFYNQANACISIDNSTYPFDYKVVPSINKDTVLLRVEYFHKGFKQTGFMEFDCLSYIFFEFNLNTYSVFSKPVFSYEKRYDEFLTEEEIDTLVNAEIRRHKDFIEEKIKTISNK